MAIQLPTLPRGADVEPVFIGFGGELKSTTGGPTLELLRLGARFGARVTLPPLTGACAAQWVAARLQSASTGETVILTMPQTRLPTVNGAGAGAINSTVVTGGAGQIGQFFSFAAGGRNYLHMRTAGGCAPRLRAVLAGAMEFVAPKLEGKIQGPDHQWTIKRLRFVGVSFYLVENK